MRFQFIHAADLHLDTPFTGMHRVDGRLAATLRDATTQAFENLVAAALERSVAFVVIAGDVYDGPVRGDVGSTEGDSCAGRMEAAGFTDLRDQRSRIRPTPRRDRT